MIKVQISGAGDLKLNGFYIADCTAEEINNVIGKAHRQIPLRKVLRNGKLSKQTLYFPFLSYHSNELIATAYNQRNFTAKLEIIEEVKPVQRGNLKIMPCGSASFSLWGETYGIIPSQSRIASTIWLDDEGDVYNKLHSMDEEEKEQLFVNYNSRNTLLVDEQGRHVPEHRLEDWLGWAKTAEEKETINEALEYLRELDEEQCEQAKKYFKKYRKSIRFAGYWANR